jgi:hypothetical protein
MEIEIKTEKGKSNTIRHWTDKEVKELHKSKGYSWRSNRLKLRVLSVTDEYRKRYDDIDWSHEVEDND